MLRDTITANGPLWLAVGGLIIGFAFGAIVMRTNFCTMGAISDMMTFGDRRRWRAWILAAATALVGAQALDAAGVVQLSGSMYLAPSLNWVGHILGGLMFGFGMVFAGGCASRNLARVGGGDLRSLITLIVIAVFAYMTIGGLLGPLRAMLEDATRVSLAAPSQALDAVLAPRAGLSPLAAKALLTGVIAAVSFLYCFASAEFRASPVHILSGVGIGLCAIAGWALTGLAFDDLAERPTAPISLTYVRPMGDTLEWLQRFTAARMPGFGVTTVLGAILGAFVTAKAMGRFRLTTFSDTGDTIRCLIGGAMMGIGGVLALGCTVGQAVTGVSTLAIGSYLTFVAIVIGGIWGIRALERWLMAEA